MALSHDHLPPDFGLVRCCGLERAKPSHVPFVDCRPHARSPRPHRTNFEPFAFSLLVARAGIRRSSPPGGRCWVPSPAPETEALPNFIVVPPSDTWPRARLPRSSSSGSRQAADYVAECVYEIRTLAARSRRPRRFATRRQEMFSWSVLKNSIRDCSDGRADQPAVAAAAKPRPLKVRAVATPSSAPTSEMRAAKAMEVISPSTTAAHHGGQKSATLRKPSSDRPRPRHSAIRQGPHETLAIFAFAADQLNMTLVTKRMR